jgi:hypothetical protein
MRGAAETIGKTIASAAPRVRGGNGIVRIRVGCRDYERLQLRADSGGAIGVSPGRCAPRLLDRIASPQDIMGCRYSISCSRGELVLVNQAAEEIVAVHDGRIDRRRALCDRRVNRVRRAQVEGAVRPSAVVVADVDAEDVLELAAVDDQEPVETLAPDTADPSLDVGVRVGRLDRRADDRSATGCSKRRPRCVDTRIEGVVLVGGRVQRWLHQSDHHVLDLPRPRSLAPSQAGVVELPLA